MLFPLLRDHRPCPVCRATDRFRPLDVYDNRQRRVTAAARLALVGCEGCGGAFSMPLPTEAQLDAFYGTPEGWESRMGEDAETSDLPRKLATKHDRYGRARDLLAPHLPPRDGAPRRALDFGCGLGAWLDVLQDDGWETWGIEPGPWQREHAGRRHRMLDAPPAEARFDLVVVNHVIEHLLDPVGALRSLAACTVPDGRLFVSVPDLGRVGEHGKLDYVRNERHIGSYTFDAMRSLLGLAGFAVIAHLDTPEWDALGTAETWHLKVLAARAGEPVDPSGEPLRQAVDALRLYEANAERREHAERRRHEERKASRRAAKRAAKPLKAQRRPPRPLDRAVRAVRRRLPGRV